MHNHQPIAMTR